MPNVPTHYSPKHLDSLVLASNVGSNMITTAHMGTHTYTPQPVTFSIKDASYASVSAKERMRQSLTSSCL